MQLFEGGIGFMQQYNTDISVFNTFFMRVCSIHLYLHSLAAEVQTDEER